MATQSITQSLFVVFAVLQILDALTTIHILAKGGRELNPVMRWIFEKLGVINGVLIVKCAIILVFQYAMPYIPVWVYLLMIGIYSYVFAHNLVQLKK